MIYLKITSYIFSMKRKKIIEKIQNYLKIYQTTGKFFICLEICNFFLKNR